MSRNFSLVWAFLTLVHAVVVNYLSLTVGTMMVISLNWQVLRGQSLIQRQIPVRVHIQFEALFSDHQYWWIKTTKDQLI